MPVHLYDWSKAEYQTHFERPELGLKGLALLNAGHQLHQYIQGCNQFDAVVELIKAELLGSTLVNAMRGDRIRPKFKHFRGLLWNLSLTYHLLVHLNLELLVLLYGFVTPLHPLNCKSSQVANATVQVQLPETNLTYAR